VDHPRNDFEQPRIFVCARINPDAKLFDQTYLIALRVVQKHTDGIAAAKQFARKNLTPAAAEQTMAQLETRQPEKALEDVFFLQDFDIAAIQFNVFGIAIAHQKRRSVYQLTSRACKST